MFARKRKTTRNSAVQFVRTKEGKGRQKIICHMDSTREGHALDPIGQLADREQLSIGEDQ